MNFLETLKSHTGALIRLKGELFWYGGRGWDGAPDRVCLILDAALLERSPSPGAVTIAATPAASAAALLLIEDRLQWVWVAESDLELIT